MHSCIEDCCLHLQHASAQVQLLCTASRRGSQATEPAVSKAQQHNSIVCNVVAVSAVTWSSAVVNAAASTTAIDHLTAETATTLENVPHFCSVHKSSRAAARPLHKGSPTLVSPTQTIKTSRCMYITLTFT